MKKRNTPVFEYKCDDCHDRFEVVMTFDEHQPFDRDDQGQPVSMGYPEEHPECPVCHSHDVVRVEITKAD